MEKGSRGVDEKESLKSNIKLKSDNKKWWLFVLAGSLVYGTNYTDKVVFGAMGPELMKGFHFTKVEFGLLATIFGLSYTFFQVPVSCWTDVKGRRKGVGFITSFYGVFTIITGFAVSSFAALGIARALTGLGEAASMPSVTGALTPWVPISHRGTSQGLMHSTTRIASALTLPVAVITYLSFGITGPFITFGLFTIAVGIFWYVIYRDKGISICSIKDKRSDLAQVIKSGIRSKSLWALCLADFCYFYTLTVYIVWLPTYLVDARHFSLSKAGLLGAIPWIGGAVGGVLGGKVSDYFCAKTGNVKLWRRVIPSFCMLGTIPLLMGAVYVHGSLAMTLLFTASFFVLDGTIAIFWAMSMDMGGKYSGATAAWMNTWANVGGLVSPVVFGVLVQNFHSWIIPFGVAGAVMFVGAVLVWLIDPSSKLDFQSLDSNSKSPIGII